MMSAKNYTIFSVPNQPDFGVRKVLTTLVKFAVCDDEQEMIARVSDKLRIYYPDECEIKTYVDGASLLSDCGSDCFDAVFLDIGMPGMNGMEVAEKIRENDHRVKIIFVTNKNELAYKGYIYGAFRFVRKSNLEQELCEAVKSLSDFFSLQSEYFVFDTPKGEIIRSVNNINYFEADGHSITMVCSDESILICGTLREYEERMRNSGFIRIHKSYLVNFRHIRSVEKNDVYLTCGKKLPLSRCRADDTRIKIMLFSKNLST